MDRLLQRALRGGRAPTDGSPRTARGRAARALLYLVLTAGAVTMLIPLAWVVSTSLKRPDDVFKIPPEWIPRRQVARTIDGVERELYRTRVDGRLRRVALIDERATESTVLVLDDSDRADPALSGRPVSVATASLTPIKEVHLVWSNYRDAWRAIAIDHYLVDLRIGERHVRWLHITHAFLMFYINSIVVALVVTVGQVSTSSLAAYAFARLSFPGRDRLFLGYLATMMIPATVTMIPNFVLLRSLHLIDTYWALVLPPLFSAYGTFMLRQFFMTIPTELEDAAYIDGCNKLGVYRHVMLPLSKPALATLATFVFMGSWNNFMWPLIVTNSAEKKTLPIGLASFQGLYNTEWTLLMAASVVFILPVIAVFVFNQRYFVEGIQLSGLGGR